MAQHAGSLASAQEVEQCYKDYVLAHAWRGASEHFCGSGLELGQPDLTAARSARRELLKDGHWQLVASLDATVCGGGMLPARFGESCPFCGLESVTPYHILWQCIELSSLDDEFSYLARSDRLRSIYASQSPMQECLWARGIIPYDLLERPGDHWYDGVVFRVRFL